MDRKQLIKIAGVLLLLASLLILLLWTSRRSTGGTDEGGARAGALLEALPKKDRSLLLITIDTTRPDRLSPYGSDNVATPNLQRLADAGVLMEDAYAVAPLTLPAHTSIMTGLYPPQHGVRNNGIHYAGEELETLAEIARADGRRTAAFVSAAVLEKQYGLTQGFELYDDDLSAGRIRAPRVVPDRPAGATVDSALRWLESLPNDEKFFAWVHFYDPHAVYNPPPPFDELYADRPYDGEVAYMDQEIGRLLEHRRLQDEELVVAVVGDHGESLGEHGERTHGVLAYRSTLQVPMILNFGEGAPEALRGKRVSAPVSQVDMLPTLGTAVGLSIPENVAGRDLFASAPVAWAARSIYSESYLPFYTYGWSKIQVVRNNGWELLQSSRPELYNLDLDPRELTDLFPDQENAAHDMTVALRKLEDLFGADANREQGLMVDAESVARLQALGYVAVGSTPQVAEEERPNPADVIDMHVALENGRQHLRNRLWDLAEDQLREALAQDPNNLAARSELANALQGAGRFDAAAAELEAALALDPENQGMILQLAALERARGELEQALQLIDAAAAINERNSAVWIQRASFFLATNQVEEASEALERGLAHNPESAYLNALYAFHVESRRDTDLTSSRSAAGVTGAKAAKERLEEVVERDPFLAAGWLFLGRLYERDNDLTKAEELYLQGLAKRSDDPSLIAALGSVMTKLEKPEAERVLLEAIRLSPAQFPADLHIALGAHYAGRGEVDEALAEYERVLEVQPRHGNARNNRAVLLAQTGRAEEALAELEALTEAQPRYVDALNNLAGVARFLSRWELARSAARRCVQLAPTIGEAWSHLAAAERALGNLDSALEAADQAVHVSAAESEFTKFTLLLDRAEILIELGEFERAATDLDEAATMEADSLRLSEARAKLAEKLADAKVGEKS